MSKSKLKAIFPNVVSWKVKANLKDRKFVHETIVHAIVSRNLSERSNICIRSGPVNVKERRYQERMARLQYKAEEKRVRAKLAAK